MLFLPTKHIIINFVTRTIISLHVAVTHTHTQHTHTTHTHNTHTQLTHTTHTHNTPRGPTRVKSRTLLPEITLKSEITVKNQKSQLNSEITSEIKKSRWNHEITNEILKSRVEFWNHVDVYFCIFPYTFVHVCDSTYIAHHASSSCKTPTHNDMTTCCGCGLGS